MIIAITGGSGFIGKRIAKRHLDNGDDVRVLTRLPIRGGSKSFSFYCGDLTDGAIDYLGWFLKDVDILYHCALPGTERLVEASAGRVKRFVYLSSVGLYGKRRDGIVTENDILKPSSIYESVKAHQEGMVTSSPLDWSILRPSNVFASDMPNQSLFQMISMIKRGLFFFIGRGAVANYIHADNVAEALFLCGTHPKAVNRVYNISDERSLTSFVTDISHLTGADIYARLTLPIPEKPLRFIVRYLERIPRFPLTTSRIDALTTRATYSSDKIKYELGYSHAMGMFEGLREMIK